MADLPKDNNKEATVIGNDTHIKGEMTFKKSVRLVGSLEGRVVGDGELHVAEGARCKADVESPAVVVDGAIEGNVTARDKVQLNAKGVVRGDIRAGKMVMSEGASFYGQCAIGPEAIKDSAPARPGPAASHTTHAGTVGSGQRPPLKAGEAVG
jgi:cytoskeletal protein CcmA (bactofilin family)